METILCQNETIPEPLKTSENKIINISDNSTKETKNDLQKNLSNDTTITKKCTKCQIEKSLNEFYIRKDRNTTETTCKICRNIARILHRSNNKEQHKIYSQRSYQKHKLKRNEEYKNWYSKNKEKRTNDRKIWRNKNKHVINAKAREKIITNPNIKLSRNLRRRINSAIKNNQKIGSAIKDLGCSINDLKLYFESKFIPGMTWSNQGEWHIDHIRPLASFDLTKREQFLEACHYTNLQPLWAKDNFLKGDKI